MARINGLVLVLSLVFALAFHSSGAQAQSPAPAPATARAAARPLAPAPPSTTETPLAPEPSTSGMPLAPGPGGANDCMTAITDNLASCLTYVEAGSNLTRPEKGCCQGLAVVVNTQLVCLCSLVSSTNFLGIEIDRTKSLMLPTVCRVKTPPVSLCSYINGGAPVSSPVGSPVAPAAPAEATGPAAPTPAGNAADTSSRSSALVLLAGLSFATVAIF